MASTEIRTRTDSDIPALVEALTDVYSTDGYPVEGTATAAAFLDPDGIAEAWVALHDGIVVGHVAIIAGVHGHQAAVRAWIDLPGSGGDTEHTVVVARLFVCKYARGLGLARRLIEKTCDWARDNDMKIVMNVIDKDIDAMRLYEKVGFRRIGVGKYDTVQGKTWTQYFYVHD